MRLLPYTVPVLITTVFIATATTSWLWLAVGIVFLIAFSRERFGKFGVREVVSEYSFFHFNKQMANLKTVSGLFFAGFNIWIPFFLFSHDLPLLALVVFVYSIVILNSNFAISLAHDLMHSTRRLDRLVSTLILLQNGFFYLESDHIYIHHRYVGTKNDPATAKIGESLYAYFLRSISARMKMIFLAGTTFPKNIEKKIIRGNWVRFVICMFWLIISGFLSAQIFFCVLAQFVLVTLIYESVTYIQHYGLQRNHDQHGKPEIVQLQHAWNCYYKTSAYMHYMMPVHSIHHLKEENLQEIMDFAGPSMPLPFASMMMTAFIPSRWFQLMDEHVLRFSQKSL